MERQRIDISYIKPLRRPPLQEPPERSRCSLFRALDCQNELQRNAVQTAGEAAAAGASYREICARVSTACLHSAFANQGASLVQYERRRDLRETSQELGALREWGRGLRVSVVDPACRSMRDAAREASQTTPPQKAQRAKRGLSFEEFVSCPATPTLAPRTTRRSSRPPHIKPPLWTKASAATRRRQVLLTEDEDCDSEESVYNPQVSDEAILREIATKRSGTLKERNVASLIR